MRTQKYVKTLSLIILMKALAKKSELNQQSL